MPHLQRDVDLYEPTCLDIWRDPPSILVIAVVLLMVLATIEFYELACFVGLVGWLISLLVASHTYSDRGSY